MLKWYEVANYAYKQRSIYIDAIPRAGALDFLLWGLQDAEAAIAASGVFPTTVPVDPARAGAYFKMMFNPESLQRADVQALLSGKKFEGSSWLFSPEYDGMTRVQATEHAAGDNEDGGVDSDPEPDWSAYEKSDDLKKIPWRMLYLWQRAIVNLFLEPEDAITGREIYWVWEPLGNVGKSVLATYLVDRCGAIEVGGASRDASHAMAEYVASRGSGPRMVIFDLARSESGEIDYTAIEHIKNGKIFSPKYKSGMVRFNRPHCLVFANQPPDESQLSSDRWKILQLGVDIVVDE